MSEFGHRSIVSRRSCAAVLSCGVALLAGCSPANEQTTASTAASAPTTIETVRTEPLSAARFAEFIAADDVIVINVHVPYDGHIDGTDVFVPFDEIGSSPLPDDQTRPIALYCRSGAMSATATQTLVEMGYTNVVDLAGGMNAWIAAGRPLKESLEN